MGWNVNLRALPNQSVRNREREVSGCEHVLASMFCTCKTFLYSSVQVKECNNKGVVRYQKCTFAAIFESTRRQRRGMLGGAQCWCNSSQNQFWKYNGWDNNNSASAGCIAIYQRRVRLAEGAPQTLQPSIALANVVLSIDHSAIATWDLQHYKWFKGEEEGASKTLCSWFKEAATKYCVGQCQNIVLKQFEETSAKKWFERTQENTCKDLLPLVEWHR